MPDAGLPFKLHKTIGATIELSSLLSIGRTITSIEAICSFGYNIANGLVGLLFLFLKTSIAALFVASQIKI